MPICLNTKKPVHFLVPAGVQHFAVFSVELRVRESVASSRTPQLFPMRQSLSTHVLPKSIISASTHAARSASELWRQMPHRSPNGTASESIGSRAQTSWLVELICMRSTGDGKRHGPRLYPSLYIRLLALSLSSEQHRCTSAKWLQKQTHVLKQQQSTSVPYSPRCQHPTTCAASSANSEHPPVDQANGTNSVSTPL
jgi:hypothetical protein